MLVLKDESMGQFAIIFTLFLGLATPIVAQEAKQVKDEPAFKKLIVDKKWTHAWGEAWLKIKSDGTFTGNAPQGKVKGTWYWKGKKFCRQGAVGTVSLKEECQRFYMIGNRIFKNVNKNSPKGSYYFLR